MSKRIYTLTIILFLSITLLFGFLAWKWMSIATTNSSPSKLEVATIIPISITVSEITPVPESTNTEVIGFLPSWMVAQNASVVPSRLTQIIYFGLGVNHQGDIIRYDLEGKETLEWYYFTSEAFTKIREEAKKSGTKILVSLKNFDNWVIDRLISSPTATDELVKQLKSLIDTYNLDGINIDFEYITQSDFPTATFLTRFLNTISKNLKTGNPALIISIDINSSFYNIDKAYDITKIGASVDQVIVMAYDYTTATSDHAGPTAPLFGENATPAIDSSIQTLQGKVPLSKIIVALPFYGYEWQTVSQMYGSQTIENSGRLATYKRVSEFLKNNPDIKVSWNETAKSPWLVYNKYGIYHQIYFDNEKSLKAKIDYIKERKLAGVGIWALGYEGNSDSLWQIVSSINSGLKPE